MFKGVSCTSCHGRGYITMCTEDTSGNGLRYNCVCSETCKECNGIGVISVTMTNGDRIRRCTNKELAKVRMNLKNWAIYAGDPLRLLWDSEEDFLLWLNKETDDIDKETIFKF